MSWLPVADLSLPIGDALYVGGIVILGAFTTNKNVDRTQVRESSLALADTYIAKKKRRGKAKGVSDPPDVTYPGNDPTKSPGEGFEWRGQQPVGGEKGAWVNQSTGEQWHPDLNHQPPKGPHWDYTDVLGVIWSVFENGVILIWGD